MKLYPFTCNVTEYRDHDAWIDSRKSGVGASETASIFGVGYAGSSPITVYESKVSDDRPVISPDLQRLFDRGHRMEPVIAAEVADETGWPISDPGEYTVFGSLDCNMFATLDRVIEHPEHGPIPLELKNVHGREWRNYEGDEPPLKHVVQVQHQLAVTGATHAMLAVLVGGADLKLYTIARDEQFIAVMKDRLAEFWGYVHRRELPPVDESEATAKALARIFPQDDGESVELPSESVGWVEDLAEAKAKEKEAKAEVTEISNKIKHAIGTATYGEIPGGGRFSWKTQERKGYTVEPSQSRVLRKLKK